MLRNILISGFLCLVLLTSCSGGASEDLQDNSDRGKLVNLYGSLYRSQSNKAQPELIIAENVPDKLAAFQKWVQSGKPESLPPIERIERIHVFQMEYSSAAVSDYDYYMSITYTNQDQYLKKIDRTMMIDFDSYDPTKNSLIVEKAGLEDWLKAEPLTVFD